MIFKKAVFFNHLYIGATFLRSHVHEKARSAMADQALKRNTYSVDLVAQKYLNGLITSVS